MIWKTYRVVLRLRSPLHIGAGKVGNVQRTRPYVTGRVLWGALTERLTRDRSQGQGPATDSQQYANVGQEVHERLAFTYLYPTTCQDGVVELWPWDDGFRPLYLSTYASTALTYPQQSAAEGTLHEVECIVPHTLDNGAPVYLAGYVFAQDNAPDWKSALKRLQLGGERGYGWGRVEPVSKPAPWNKQSLFDGSYNVEPGAWPPVLTAVKKTHLLAHALAADFDKAYKAVTGVDGEIEPLVGREVDPTDGRFGVHLSRARICYAPGARVEEATQVRIGPYGVWERCPEPRPESDEGPAEGAP
ncbi:MAG: hypothetical protein IMY86_09500 [Chloroflexi bacterium]|nr:hypothetical protein [Chloroflexota bacterium]